MVWRVYDWLELSMDLLPGECHFVKQLGEIQNDQQCHYSIRLVTDATLFSHRLGPPTLLISFLSFILSPPFLSKFSVFPFSLTSSNPSAYPSLLPPLKDVLVRESWTAPAPLGEDSAHPPAANLSSRLTDGDQLNIPDKGHTAAVLSINHRWAQRAELLCIPTCPVKSITLNVIKSSSQSNVAVEW